MIAKGRQGNVLSNEHSGLGTAATPGWGYGICCMRLTQDRIQFTGNYGCRHRAIYWVDRFVRVLPGLRDGRSTNFEKGRVSIGTMPASEIIDAARNGDSKALEQLIRLCQPDVRRYALRSCSNAADVEDAIQEATIVLYRKLGTLQTIAAFSQWLKTVVRRECLRLAQRIPGRQIEIDAIKDDLRFSSTPTSELRMEIVDAISSLPPIYREMIILRDFEEFTIKEIAARLEITTDNAKVRLHRARFLVREYFLT